MDENSNNNQMKDFSNSFKFLFSAIFDNYTDNIINLYNNYCNNNNKINTQEPYTFLYQILNILKEENQKETPPFNHQNNLYQKWLSERFDFEKCFNSFKDNIKKYERSCISDCLYFSQIETYNCAKCGNYYNFSLLPMVQIDLNNFSQEGALKYNLKEYINTNFSKQFNVMCKGCQSQASAEYKIINISQILIIHIYRRDPTSSHKTEINLDIKLDITNCILHNDKIFPNKEFRLKGYIGYDEKNGYFFDYNYKSCKDNLKWIRYSENKYNYINLEFLNNCKPILLFYEAIDDKKILKEKINYEANKIILKKQIQNQQLLQNNNNNIPNQNQNYGNANNNINNNMNNNMMPNNANNMNNINMMPNNMNHMNNNVMQNNANAMMNNNMNNNMMPNNANTMMNNNMNNNMMPNNANTMMNNNMNNNACNNGMMQGFNSMMMTNAFNNQRMMQMQMQHQMQIQQQMQMQQQILMQQQMEKQKQDNCNKVLEAMDNKNINLNIMNPENDKNNIKLNFQLIEEKKKDNILSECIMCVKKTEKMNEIFGKYLSKLQVKKEDNYIKKFTLNNNEISMTSTQTAEELKLKNDSKIIAIKNVGK